MPNALFRELKHPEQLAIHYVIGVYGERIKQIHFPNLEAVHSRGKCDRNYINKPNVDDPFL